MSTDNTQATMAIARDAIALGKAAPSLLSSPLTSDDHRVSAAALARLAVLIELQSNADDGADELCCATARIVVQTWIIGHSVLLLGEAGRAEVERHESATRALVLGSVPGPTESAPGPSLLDLARRLDAHVYGAIDPPRAFQRHVRSFYDEIDISGVEGTRSRLLAASAGPAQVSRPTQVDYVRVGLWVLLFLAHDHYAAVGAIEHARSARALFDRLREATDAFYARRRQERSAPPS